VESGAGMGSGGANTREERPNQSSELPRRGTEGRSCYTEAAVGKGGEGRGREAGKGSYCWLVHGREENEVEEDDDAIETTRDERDTYAIHTGLRESQALLEPVDINAQPRDEKKQQRKPAKKVETS